jgi:hypothetical protein
VRTNGTNADRQLPRSKNGRASAIGAALVREMLAFAAAAALNTLETRGDAPEILRGLLERIELRAEPDGYAILLRGDLAGILTLASDSKKPATGGVTGFRK